MEEQKWEMTGIRLPVIRQIIELAEHHKLSEVILFGSRARGDHREKSDIDLAVSGEDITYFCLDIEEKTETLLQYDIIDLKHTADEELLENVKKDGIVLYEKV